MESGGLDIGDKVLAKAVAAQLIYQLPMQAANITMGEEVYAIRGLDAGALEERMRT